MQVIENSIGTSLQLDKVPSGAGVIALIQSDSIEQIDGTDYIVAEAGISQRWRHFTTNWYGGVVWPATITESDDTGSAPISLSPRQVQGTPVGLLDASVAAISEATPNVIVQLDPNDKDYAVSVPCGVRLRMSADGVVAALTYNFGDSASGTIAAGDQAIIDVDCSNGETVATGQLRALSYTSRSSVVVLNLLGEGQ